MFVATDVHYLAGGAMTLLVVDGFADLDPDGSPGLGAREFTMIPCGRPDAIEGR